MPKQALFDVAVTLYHETPSAWLVSEDDDKKVWIPKSICEMEKVADGSYILTAPEWILKDKGLI